MSVGASAKTEGADNGQEVSYDETFDLLSNHRRRYTLHYLKANGESAELGTLSDYVAAWENEIPPNEVSYDQRKRVYTSLQQVHLPRMDKMGVVEFDDRDGVVELTPAAQQLDIYLEVVGQRDVPWSVLYLVLAAINAVVLAAAALGLPGFAAVPDLGWGLFAVTTFVVASVAHLYISRQEMKLGGTEKPRELLE